MEFTLRFTAQDMEILNLAIGEIPFKLAAPLVAKINKQISEQQQSADEGKENGTDTKRA